MIRTVKKPDERRADIIEAAQHLFMTQEYEKTTMQDVMTELGIAKGTIYHYFPSKEALLEAVVENIIDTTLERMQTRVQETQGDALKKLQVLIEAGNVASAHSNILEGLNRPGNEAMHTRLLAATIIKQAPLYAEVIKQGCDEGIFQTCYPLECAEFILSAVQFLTDRGIYPWHTKDLMRRAQAFPSLLEQQLKSPAGSFQFLMKFIQPR